MKHKILILIAIMSTLILGYCTSKSPYLAQDTPGRRPELFAPSIVNTDSVELNGVFNSSFTEFFFTRIISGSFIIHHSELVNRKWTTPKPIYMFANCHVISTAVDMTVTQDGNTMYFLGIYPENTDSLSTADIYQSNKIDGQWQLATKVGHPISTDKYDEIYPVVVADGSLYFGSDRPGGTGKRDIYRAQYLGEGKFDTPKSLGLVVNTALGSGDTYVSSDESFLICNSRRPEGIGMYISFKMAGEWQTPIYLGEPINSEWTDFCPYMTPDNKYFLFSRRYSDPPESGWDGVTKGEVYWVNASVVFEFRNE